MKKYQKMGVVVWIVLLIAIPVYLFYKPTQEQLTEEQIDTFSGNEYGDTYLDFVDANLVSGGVPKDGIPSIDKPQYVSAEEADTFLDDDDAIFGLDYEDTTRAYPQKILYWHEIVNEHINGEDISVTYCPLTATVIGFKGKHLGVSGKLYNSNLVFYDRETDSEVPQILERPVNGPLKGQDLDNVYVYTTTWKQWKTTHPDTLVLSTKTGFSRDYDRNPYPGYEQLLQVWFPVAATNDQFHSKKIVHGVFHNNDALAIPKEEFKSTGEATTMLGGEELTLTYDTNLDVITVHDLNGEHVNSYDAYWFAWYAYHPDTAVYS